MYLHIEGGENVVKRYKITDYANDFVYTYLSRKAWRDEIDLLRKIYGDTCIFTICKNHPRHMVITKR